MLNQGPVVKNIPPSINLQRLFILRGVGIAVQLVVVALVVMAFDMSLVLGPIVAVILIETGFNIYTWWRSQKAPQVSSAEFFIQLVFDVLALTAILYFSGGFTNPFIFLFLLPLMIAASTMPGRHAWGMAGLTVGCYTLLMYFYVPLPHINHTGIADIDLHFTGMWFGFILSVILIMFFVMKMANSLRERDRVLAQTREKTLRDEHLVALGTLAAGAAHELGTPLSTMAVLAREIELENGASAGLSDKTRILRQQLDRCKHILSSLSERSGHGRAENSYGLALDHYLHQLVEEWHAIRPAANIKCDLHGNQPAPFIVVDKTLNQAFFNILNNAADASIDHIEVHGEWSPDELVFDVCDSGRGLDPSLRELVGKPYFSTKGDGHGLGLFLSQAVVSRFGGTVQLLNREEGGVCAHIVLPLARLLLQQAPIL